MPDPPILHIVGPKNAGKTRLMEWLVRTLTERGFKIGALKHSMHTHPVDKPNSDSDRFRNAGAHPAAFWSDEGLGIYFPPLKTQENWQILQAVFADCDLVLVESFGTAANPKIVIATENEPRENFQNVIAFVSSHPIPGEWPVFAPNTVALVDFILQYFDLAKPAK